MELERVEYRGWRNAYRLGNASVELIVLADVGPRIIWFGARGGENELHEIDADAGQTGGDKYRFYGGHRLWAAPEGPRTMFPDNVPVQVAREGDSVRFTAPVESSGLQREIEVHLGNASEVVLTHRIWNRGNASTEVAPWALTMMRAGGRGILPLPPRAPHDDDHLLPTVSLAMWTYTDLADPRWIFGSEYVQLQQQAKPAGRFEAQKIGARTEAAWAAYIRSGHLFLKQAPQLQPHAKYPDLGCNVEMFTDPTFLESETLGPLQILKKDEHVEHVERWRLWLDVQLGTSDDEVRNALKHYL